MIRLFTMDDADRVMHGLDRLRLFSPMAPFPIDMEKGYAMLTLACQHEAAWVSENDGKIDGFIICGIKPLWWNESIKIGTDIFFTFKHAEDAGDLLRKLVRWCGDRGANMMQCIVASSSRLDDVKPIYEGAGFRLEGSTFVMNQEGIDHVRSH